KAQVELGGYFDSAERRERIARDQRAVAGVQERDMPGCVAGRGDHLQAPDALAGRHAYVGDRLDLWPAAGHLALDDGLAGVDARVQVREEHLHRVAETPLQRVEGADVVAVAMGQRDAADLIAGALRGG